MNAEFLAEATDWIGTQEECANAERQACLERVAERLEKLARQQYEQVNDRVGPDKQTVDIYAKRVWICLEYHWKRLANEKRITFEDVVKQLQPAETDDETPPDSILRDVVLAQSLELGETGAAERFETEYMPVVRAMARRTGGQRAMDAVENFAADLILTRGDRPARIAKYQGRTFLKSWLRTVVVNFCVSGFRKQREVHPETLPELAIAENTTAPSDHSHCEGLLRPIFMQSVKTLDSEDRLLVTMLVLDDVPQRELARAMGIDSGNVTRRRQKIMAAIWNRVNELAAEQNEERSLTDCLDLILAGESRELRESLAELLATGMRDGVAVDKEGDR